MAGINARIYEIGATRRRPTLLLPSRRHRDRTGRARQSLCRAALICLAMSCWPLSLKVTRQTNVPCSDVDTLIWQCSGSFFPSLSPSVRQRAEPDFMITDCRLSLAPSPMEESDEPKDCNLIVTERLSISTKIPNPFCEQALRHYRHIC